MSAVETAADILRAHGKQMRLSALLQSLAGAGVESSNVGSMLAAEASKPDGRVIRTARGFYAARDTTPAAPAQLVPAAASTERLTLRERLKRDDTAAAGVDFDEIVDAAYDSDLLILAGMHRRALEARETAMAA